MIDSGDRIVKSDRVDDDRRRCLVLHAFLAMREACVLVGPGAEPLLVNDAFLRRVGFGVTTLGADGRLQAVAFDGATMDAVKEALVSSDPQFALTARLRGRDGRLLVLEAHGTTVTEGTSIVGAFLVFDRDPQQFDAARLESLRQLAGNIASGFHNLLSVIVNNVNLAVSRARDPSVTSLLELVTVSAQRASTLAKQLLVYAGHGEFLARTVSIAPLLREVMDLAGHPPPKARLELRLGATLPSTVGDPDQLRQVFLQLTLFAIESVGQQEGMVTLSAESMDASEHDFQTMVVGAGLSAGRYLRVRVTDTGAGLDADTQSRIFDPFFASETPGRGFGLAMVLGILKSHQGAIGVRSVLGQGTVFEVLLPTQGDARTSSHAPALLQGDIVLVIDDDEAVRNAVSGALQAHGYTVLGVDDGAEGLELFRTHARSVGAVILDLTMPGIHGTGVFRDLRRLNPSVPILISSGYATLDVLQRIAMDPHAAFLEKPYEAHILLQRLQRLATAR
ncbi:MAG: response regulator [Myxococcales bacterium]